jgi:ADP-heptose:LPS heptosyltransferase
MRPPWLHCARVKVSTMRVVDAVAGIPCCALLSSLRWLLRPFRRRVEGPPKKIVFLKLAEQGSTVLAHAALARAVEMVGAENVYFLVFEQNRGVLDAMAVIPKENVVAIRTPSLPGTVLSTLQALRRLRRLQVDAAVDLEFFARSTAVLACLSGARIRVGLHAFSGDGPWRGNLMTHRLGYNPHLHTSQFFRLLVEALLHPAARFPAFDTVAPPLDAMPRGRFAPSAEEQAEVAEVLRQVTGVERPRLVLLNANCSDLLPLRKWNEANYVDLARRLLDGYPELRIAFTGAPSEAPAVDTLVRAIGSPRAVSMAGKTTLHQLLVLYGLADVLITNDSGPAHFASLTPVDVVTLFGPETPDLFSVLGERSHVIWARTACSPCVNAYNNRVSKCRDNVCMQRITVDEVYAAARACLEARGVHEKTAAPKRAPLPDVVMEPAARRRRTTRRRAQ